MLAAIPYTTFPEIGPIRTFGLFVGIGVLLGAWIAGRYIEERAGIDREESYRMATRLVVAGRVLPDLTCDGFGFDCEFLAACGRLGIPVAEVPVCVRYADAASTTGPRTMLGMLRELWRIRRAGGRGRPVRVFAPPAEVLGPVSEPVPVPELVPVRKAA